MLLCIVFRKNHCFRKNRRNASEPTATWESRERAERCCGCNWRRGWVRLPSRAYIFVPALRFNNILYVRFFFSDPKPNAHADVLVSGAVTKVKPLLLTLLIYATSLLRYEVVHCCRKVKRSRRKQWSISTKSRTRFRRMRRLTTTRTPRTSSATSRESRQSCHPGSLPKCFHDDSDERTLTLLKDFSAFWFCAPLSILSFSSCSLLFSACHLYSLSTDRRYPSSRHQILTFEAIIPSDVYRNFKFQTNFSW